MAAVLPAASRDKRWSLGLRHGGDEVHDLLVPWGLSVVLAADRQRNRRGERT
ncbi:hypothetical protein [Rhodococcus sp. 14-2483-1-2]|uniref:hypothetical protein n=1 Tax=Rhodococcus sp. 14-2483-1-2 TaxID=2023147 RepID=UPI001482C100|nr:hypothetical protein [Rhodococcus sp. 14-2483-1-2]